MNNLEIEAILYTNKITRKNFIGTYTPNDLVKLKKIKNCATLIVNVCNYGCHWISITLDRDSLNYFVSSGTKSYLLNLKIKDFLIRQKRKKIFVNLTPIQAFSSDLCGLFSIMFVYFISKGKTMKDFLLKFSKNNLKINDNIVLELFKKNL